VRALKVSADENAQHMELLTAALVSNEKAHRRIVDKVEKALNGSLINKKICVWGLTFKANTDDLRESPAIAVAERLIGRGASVVAFDPSLDVKKIGKIIVENSIESSVKDADAIVLLTEWNLFRSVEPSKIGTLLVNKIVIDSRNILDKKLWENAGFNFIGNGS